MKPGKYDRKDQVRITGAELRELKRLDMPESLGLDRRIERYQGTRPIGLYRWDLGNSSGYHCRFGSSEATV